MPQPIPTHRTGTATVKVTDSPGQSVVVKQTRHKFLFGCSEFSTLPYVNNEMEPEAKAGADKRMAHMAAMFNQVTLPFYWARYEPVRGQPEFPRTQAAAKWLAAQGMQLKGHPLCWHTSTAPWLLELSNDEIYKVQMERITRDIVAYKGLIDMWDVINEAVIMPIFDKYDNGITRLCKDRGRISLIKDLFKVAREANPDAVLLINDFEMSEAYDILIEGLLEAGVPIDVIGLQSHMHQGCWKPEKMADVLERFGRFGLPLHFTEVSLVSGEIMPKHIVDLNDHKVDSWPTTAEGEARQAQEVAWFYDSLWAHPLVEAITYWSFMDGLWLGAPSGLVSKTNDRKPAFDALYDRIKGAWWTAEETLTSGADGTVVVSGTKGDYVALCNGKEVAFTIA